MCLKYVPGHTSWNPACTKKPCGGAFSNKHVVVSAQQSSSNKLLVVSLFTLLGTRESSKCTIPCHGEKHPQMSLQFCCQLSPLEDPQCWGTSRCSCFESGRAGSEGIRVRAIPLTWAHTAVEGEGTRQWLGPLLDAGLPCHPPLHTSGTGEKGTVRCTQRR